MNGLPPDFRDVAMMIARGTDPGPLAALGIDTGPHTGMFAAWWSRADWTLQYALAFECSAVMAPSMLRVLIDVPGAPLIRLAGMEAFVARGKSVKLRGASTAAMHAEQGELLAVLKNYDVRCIARPAGTVKPWATDRRLEAAGLLKLAGTSPHIRDAARHLLFSACQAGLPDPLSAIARTGGTS